MYFSNLDDFFYMGGHGLYVWLCYAVGILIFLMAFISPILKKRQILKELKQIQRRNSVNQPNKDLQGTM